MRNTETQDEFSAIPDIVELASGRLGTELTFAFPEVLKAIEVCTENGIAVLGMEIGEMRQNGFHTNVLSPYDVGRGPDQPNGWIEYVLRNNVLAKNFVDEKKALGTVYVITAASWSEFQQVQEFRL